MQQAEQAEVAERAEAQQAEAELVQAERELSQLAASSSELDSLEERYWHDFNDFQLQLRAHVDERDVLLNKVSTPSCPLSSTLAAAQKHRKHLVAHPSSKWDDPVPMISGFAFR